MQKHSSTLVTKNAVFKLGQLLGQGQFGKVYRGHTSTQPEGVAIKIIRRSKFSKNQKLKQLLQREMEILAQFKHANVIEFRELIVEKQDVYLVYEYCQDGTLEDRIGMGQEEMLQIFQQILEGMCEAQRRGVIHRDLKPANILFKKGSVKVADWGFSRLLEDGETTCSFIGSPAYMAPQILKGEDYTLKADVWSLGVMLFEVLTGVCPWRASSVNNLCGQISKKSLKFPKNANVSYRIKVAISQMLSLQPQRRPTCRQIKEKLFSKQLSPSKYYKSELTMTSLRDEKTQQIQISGCVFFLEMVQWCRKTISNYNTLLIFVKLIEKNLAKLKPEIDQEQIFTVWEKELKVVREIKRKIQRKIEPPSFSYRSASGKKENQWELNPEGQWQQLAKNTIKYAIDMLEKGYKQRKQSQNKKQYLLTEINILLDLVLFPQRPQQYLKDTFGNYQIQLRSMTPKMLLKQMNQKLVLINKRYYN